MITVPAIQKNDKVRKRCLDAGSSSYFYYFQVHLFHLDPIRPCSLFSDIVLILLKNFILLDFCFSATCVNLIFLPFTVCINSSLFRLENGRNSLVQMIEEVYMFASLFYYTHDEPMCHKYHTEFSDNF